MQTFGRVMGSVRPPNLCLFLNYLLHFTPSTNKQNVLQEMPIVGRNVKHSVDSSKWIFCYPLFLFFFRILYFIFPNMNFLYPVFDFSPFNIWYSIFQFSFQFWFGFPSCKKWCLPIWRNINGQNFIDTKEDRPKMVGQFDKTGQIMVKYWYQT